MSALRIEPVQQPETSCTEYSIIDEAGEEIAVVTGKAWAQKFAVVEGLIEIVQQFVSECGECDGTGEVGIHICGHDTVAESDAEGPCPECTPARSLLAAAGIAV
jgi:hypothetical protein